MTREVHLEGLNRQQRRQLAKKLEQKAPPSLQQWLTEPGKLVKRGELWNVLHRYWMLKELEEQYNHPLNRLRRFLRRHLPWCEDPPPSPFEHGLLGPDPSDPPLA